MKRGQVTIFIVLGILMLIVVGAFMFTQTTKEQTQRILQPSSETASILSFVENCNKIVSAQGAYYIAAHNGYYPLPKEYTQDRNYTFVYIYQRSKPGYDTSLTLDQIEKNYANYIQNNLPLCVDHFNAFKDRGIDIKEGKVTASVKIFDNKTFVDTQYDVKVQQESGYYPILKLTQVEIPVRLGLMYKVSLQILQWILDEPNLISSKYINELMWNLSMFAYIDAFGDTSEYVIRDNQSSILNGVVITDPAPPNRRFDYVFGAKFD